jgi:hypothetical protein
MALYISPSGGITSTQVAGSKLFTGGSVGDYFPSVASTKQQPVVEQKPVSTASSYSLKNPGIASANPNAIASNGFINALYQEKFGRNATSKELESFNTRTVKDASNIILGAQLSPFYGTKTTDASSNTGSSQGSSSSIKAYDPIAEAAKYGYSAADFAGDKNFVSYWSKKTPAELKIALGTRSDWDKSKGIKKATGTVASESAIDRYFNSMVESGEMSQEDADAAKVIINGSDTKSGTALSDAEIEAKLNDIKAAVVVDQNKYYTEQTNRSLSDLKTGYDDIRNEAARYTQKEQKSYNELLAETKKSLRSRGMTFSGTSVKGLGSESAQANPTNLEGEIPQERRYSWEDASAGFQQRARNLGMEAERSLGSGTLDSSKDYLKPTGLSDPYGKGITYRTGATRDIYIPHQSDQKDYVKYGDFELKKLKTIEEETNRRMEKINSLK